MDANFINSAVEKFRELIAGLKREFDGFDSITKVSLDSYIEVKKVPTRGALAHFQEQHGEPITSIYILPYVQLAYEHFEHSYAVGDPKLKYLLLMIAAEVLFNDGPQGLRYRIARAVFFLAARRTRGDFV